MRWTSRGQIIHAEKSRPFAEVDRNRPPTAIKVGNTVCEMMASSPTPLALRSVTSQCSLNARSTPP